MTWAQKAGLVYGLVLLLWLAWVVWSSYRVRKMLPRIDEVAEYRQSLLSKIVRAARGKDDPSEGLWERRFDAFDSVSFEKMVKKWRKPVRSFYDEEWILGDEITSPDISDQEAVDRARRAGK